MNLAEKIEEVRTIPELFFRGAAERPDSEGLRFKEEGVWRSLTYREWAATVRALAAVLAPWVAPGDKVCLMSENRKEWAFFDLAVLSLGGVIAPIYPTSVPRDIAYIAEDAGARLFAVSTAAQLERVMSLRRQGELGGIQHVVVFDAVEAADPLVVTLSRLMERAGEADDTVVDQRVDALDPNGLATLIYTSGTTGQPKGVMLSHHNIIANIHAVFKRLGEEHFRESVFLSFLPLSHSLERMAGYYTAIRVNGAIAYAESIEKLVANMAEVRPTVIISVPRIYEKLYTTVLAGVSGGGAKARIFDWAMAIGREKAFAEAERRRLPRRVRLLYPIAFGLVFKKLHQVLGGRLEFAVSGGAPLAKEIAIFLKAAGLTILEGYGLTETSPVLTINGPSWIRFGSVGQTIEGVELTIDPEGSIDGGEGEILARGPNVMLGYYNKEDATTEALSPEGWLRTGDIGYIDKDGFLFVTDRKKELIKTSGGKYVAPAPIENKLGLSPFIEQAVVIGNRRKYCSALLLPNTAALEAETGKSLPAESEALARVPEARRVLQGAIDEVNRDLGTWEQLKRFSLLPRPLTIEGGELTPTLKLKRRVIDDHFAELIASMYEGD